MGEPMLATKVIAFSIYTSEPSQGVAVLDSLDRHSRYSVGIQTKIDSSSGPATGRRSVLRMARDNLAVALVEYGLYLIYVAIDIIEALSGIVMAYLRHRRRRRYG